MTVMVAAPVATAADKSCGVETSILTCPEGTDNKSSDITKNATWAMLILALNILTVGVGIASVGAIVYASILYTTSSDDTGRLQKAKTIIRDTIIGLLFYGFMYLIINYITPGGLFN